MINLEKSNFFVDPYTHCVFDNIFSENDYDDLVKNFPDIGEMVKMEDPKNNNKFNKYQLSSRNHKIRFNNFLKKNIICKKISDYLLSDFFLEYLIKILKKNNIEFGIPIRKKSKKRIVFDLLKKITPGYFIKPKEILNVVLEFSAIPINGGFLKPHSDGPSKLASIVIPIRDQKWNDEYKGGTNLLKPNDEKKTFNVVNNTLEFEETSILKTIEFNKNQMLVFPKSYNSLHSVGPLNGNDKNYFRRSLTLNIEKKNYTLMFDSKTKENLKYQIEKNGFVVIKNFLSKEEVEIYRKSISNLSRRESLSISGLNYFSIQKKIINILKIFVGEKIYYPFLSKPVNEIYQSQAGKSFMHNDVHVGVDDFCFEKNTNIYNTGLYLQSHNNLSGGLKVRPKSHKKICLEDLNFLLKLKRVFYFLLNKPKNISFFQIIRTLLPYKSINISIDAGDLIIWDIRLHHSGNAKKLKFFPNISLSTYLENLIPSFLTNLNKQNRYAIFTVYIGDSEYKDRYINSQINGKHISIWKDSKININPVLEIMKKNDVLPVDEILQYFKS